MEKLDFIYARRKVNIFYFYLEIDYLYIWFDLFMYESLNKVHVRLKCYFNNILYSCV